MGVNETQLSVLEDNNRKSHERARLYIQEALLLLMEENDYEKIKITDIIKKSGVSRSAFYRNYYWKKDILVDMCSRISFEDDKITVTNDVMKNWEALFEHIKRHERFYALMEKNGLTGFLLDDMNKGHFELEESTFEHILQNGMIYNVCREWIKNGMKETPEEMTDFIKRQLRKLGAKLYAIGIENDR